MLVGVDVLKTQSGEFSEAERDSCDHDRIARWFLAAVVGGLVWRLLRLALNFELTGDEAGIVLSVIERGYAKLLDPLSYSNVSPPLFLWMTKFLDGTFRSEWAVRVVPFAAGAAAIGVFWMICRDTLRGTACWLALAVFCVTEVPIAEATRAKGYTIDLPVATIMLWLTLRWLLRGRQSRYLISLALCAPVFVWVSYTSVFVIGAVGLILMGSLVKEFLFRSKDSTRAGKLEWRNAAVAILFVGLTGFSAIWLYRINVAPGIQASLQNGLADGWKRGYPPLGEPWKIPIWLLTVHTGRGYAWPIGDNHFGSTLTFGLWLVGVVAHWRRDNRWIWWLFVLPQVLAMIAAFLHKYPYLQNPRLCMFLGPGICLFVGKGYQYLVERYFADKSRLCYRYAAVALILCAIGGVVREIVLRAREVRGPGIRSTIADASKLVGPGGQFVMLNDEKISDVFNYYIQRRPRQKVWLNGQSPMDIDPAARLAVVAVASKNAHPDTDSLFAAFQRRLGRSLKIVETRVALEVLLDNKDTIVVWICEQEKLKEG